MVVQVIEQTREERVKMYMKCTKRELVEMVMNNQDIHDAKWRNQSDDCSCNGGWVECHNPSTGEEWLERCPDCKSE